MSPDGNNHVAQAEAERRAAAQALALFEAATGNLVQASNAVLASSLDDFFEAVNNEAMAQAEFNDSKSRMDDFNYV